MTVRRAMLNETFLAVLLVIGFAVCGCEKRPPSGETPVVPQTKGAEPPIEFRGYKAAFEHIALREGLPRDEETLFGLAAESTVERYRFEQTGLLTIVRAQYYDESQFEFGLRGAQGQGTYYVFQTNGNEWRLVGVVQGSAYRWDCVGDKLRLITSWHISAFESPETVYSWNGGTFSTIGLSPATAEQRLEGVRAAPRDGKTEEGLRMARKVTPFLMFEGSAEEAMRFYVTLFHGSEVKRVERYGPGEQGAEGSLKKADFTVAGQDLICFDSPVKHAFTFTPSFSLFVECENEAELDAAIDQLTGGPGR